MQGTEYENCNEPLSMNKQKFSSVEDAKRAVTNAEGMLLFPKMNPTGQLEYHSVQNSQRGEEEMKAPGSVHIQDIVL